jgi:hypothetical protein
LLQSVIFDYIDTAYAGAMKSPLYRFGMSPHQAQRFYAGRQAYHLCLEAPGNILEESGADISCAAESPEELAGVIMKMKALSSTQRAQMGAKGREWIIKNRDYKKLAADFINAVSEHRQ